MEHLARLCLRPKKKLYYVPLRGTTTAPPSGRPVGPAEVLKKRNHDSDQNLTHLPQLRFFKTSSSMVAFRGCIFCLTNVTIGGNI